MLPICGREEIGLGCDSDARDGDRRGAPVVQPHLLRVGIIQRVDAAEDRFVRPQEPWVVRVRQVRERQNQRRTGVGRRAGGHGRARPSPGIRRRRGGVVRHQARIRGHKRRVAGHRAVGSRWRCAVVRASAGEARGQDRRARGKPPAGERELEQAYARAPRRRREPIGNHPRAPSEPHDRSPPQCVWSPRQRLAERAQRVYAEARRHQYVYAAHRSSVGQSLAPSRPGKRSATRRSTSLAKQKGNSTRRASTCRSLRPSHS